MQPASFAAMLFAATSFAAVPEPAVASCVGQPIVSVHAFTGTVVYTRHGGLTARVLTGKGELVTIAGTMDPSVITLLDRSYTAGARYEFHPLNDRPPYLDNACTATHEI